MNRAIRRQAAKNERRGITRTERVVQLPALLDEFTVFDMPQCILNQLANGAIDSIQGVPVFKDNAGVWCEVSPALEGWLFTWKKINTDLQLQLDLTALITLHKRLYHAMPITRELVGNALLCLDACRQAFRASNRQEIVRIAKTAQIAIYLEPHLTPTP